MIFAFKRMLNLNAFEKLSGKYAADEGSGIKPRKL